MNKPTKTFWQIWNMSFGFMGIQFGWGLQMANMSAIYEYLGAKPDEIPLLWLAAPLTGLLVQPIVGHASDRTWGPLGRRRPYFLVGALLSSAALIAMPNSSALWMAAGLLWILDASINISMEPFRAFVADLLPEHQRTSGYAMQSIFIGLGAVMASVLPWVLTNLLKVSNAATGSSAIPPTVMISFYVGAAAFLFCVLWTIFTTREYPPENMAEFQRMKSEKAGLLSGAREIAEAIGAMPRTMRQLAPVQICSWLALFCMWLYFPIAVARNVFGAPDETSPIYTQGIEWAGICFGTYNGVCFAFSFWLPAIAKALGRKLTHSLCLICGGLGLFSVAVVSNKYLLLLSMTGVGIAWASILAIPYAVLAGSLPPARTGVYMGIFNFFIVIPQIVAATFLGWVMNHLLGNNRIGPVMVGGAALLLAALLMKFVEDRGVQPAAQPGLAPAD